MTVLAVQRGVGDRDAAGGRCRVPGRGGIRLGKDDGGGEADPFLRERSAAGGDGVGAGPAADGRRMRPGAVAPVDRRGEVTGGVGAARVCEGCHGDAGQRLALLPGDDLPTPVKSTSCTVAVVVGATEVASAVSVIVTVAVNVPSSA